MSRATNFIVRDETYTRMELPFNALTELPKTLTFTREKPNTMAWLLFAASHAARGFGSHSASFEIWCDGELVSKKSLFWANEDNEVYVLPAKLTDLTYEAARCVSTMVFVSRGIY